MAIFGNSRDKDLPILTRAYQVNVEDWSEVAAFLRSERDLLYGSAGTPEEVAQKYIWDDWNEDEKQAIGDSFIRDIIQVREEVAEALRLTREAMDSLYHRQAVRQGIINYLGVKLSKRSFFTHTDSESHSPGIDEEVPVSRLLMFGTSPVNSTVGRLVAALMTLILQCAKGEKPLSQCAECTSIFVLQRPGQNYCSHRCSHRAGQRRRAAELRA